MTRAVIEHGDTETAIEVPDTIQGVLSARIDRLPEPHKHLLQMASVLGRAFSPRLLAMLWEATGPLDPLLSELTRLEFLFARTGTEERFVFKHALTQDVAYTSLLTSRRQALHTAAGQALETLYADRLEDAYARLAYHYSRTDNAAKAVEYLTLVAEKAQQGYAHAEAVTSLQEALVHAERLPEETRDRCGLDLVIRQGEPLFWSGRRQELVALFLGQQERRERLQEPSLTGPYYLWLGFAYAFLGQREQAVQSLEHALKTGTQCGDAVLMGQAHVLLAQELNFAGALHQGIVHGQQAVSLLEGTAEHFWLGTGLYFLGLLYNATGAYHRAVEVATRVRAIGDMIGDRRLQTNALLTIGNNYTRQGGWEAGIEALQHAREIAPDAFESALIIGFLGYAYLEQGNVSEALSILEQAVVEARHYRSRQVQCMFQRYLSEAYLMSGDIEKSRVLAQQGLAFAKDLKFPSGIGTAQRTLGRIAHTSGNLPEAARCLQDALTTFEAIQSPHERARTHLDLASLAHTQGQLDTATTHLSTAHAWFQKLQVPKWMERTEQLAREYGVTLTEIELEELEELTEGSS